MCGLYLIWDERTKSFGVPMSLQNDMVAKRVFLTSVNKWPDFEDDFKLYKIGEYDSDELGRPVILYPTPVFINCFEEVDNG